MELWKYCSAYGATLIITVLALGLVGKLLDSI